MEGVHRCRCGEGIHPQFDVGAAIEIRPKCEVNFFPLARTITPQPEVWFVHVAKQHELLHDERRRQSHHELGAVGAEGALGCPAFVLETHLEIALAAVGNVPSDVQG